MKEVSVEINGKLVSGKIQKIKRTLWVHFNGQTFSYQPEVRSKKTHTSKGIHTGEVLAPMPGKINKVLVSAGDKADAGDVLVVMEAMKMEYTLKADITGQIETVNCSVNDQVRLGQVLVLLRPDQVEGS